MYSLYLHKNINLNHNIMKTLKIDLTTIIGAAFFALVILPLLASLVIGLVNGNLDTTPLN